MRTPSGCLALAKVRTLCHRIAWYSPFRFEWTANLNRTDCKLGGPILVEIYPVRFCYLQPTDLSRLSVAKLYRGFESHSLRQQVLTAEKFRRPFPQNTRNMPVFRNIGSTNRTGEKGPFRISNRNVPAFLRRAHAQSGFNKFCDNSANLYSFETESS